MYSMYSFFSLFVWIPIALPRSTTVNWGSNSHSRLAWLSAGWDLCSTAEDRRLDRWSQNGIIWGWLVVFKLVGGFGCWIFHCFTLGFALGFALGVALGFALGFALVVVVVLVVVLPFNVAFSVASFFFCVIFSRVGLIMVFLAKRCTLTSQSIHQTMKTPWNHPKKKPNQHDITLAFGLQIQTTKIKEPQQTINRPDCQTGTTVPNP